MQQEQTGYVELLLMCPVTREATFLNTPENTPIECMLEEFVPSSLNHFDNQETIIFNLTRLESLPAYRSQTILTANIRTSDTLLFGLLEDFITSDSFPKPPIPTVASVDEAKNLVRSFDHSTYIPDLFWCKASLQDFKLLVAESTENIGARNPLFGGRKLIEDLIYTVNQYYFHPIVEQNSILKECFISFQEAFSNIEKPIDDKLRFFFEKIEWYRLLCNAAALHIELAPEDSQSLVELVSRGELEINEIVLDTRPVFKAARSFTVD